MNNWKIQTKMFAGFGVVLTVLLCLGLYMRTQLKTINLAAHRIDDDTLPGTYLIAQYQILTQERKLVLRNHLSATSPLEMNRLEAENRLIIERIGKIISNYEKTVFEPRDRELFAALQKERSSYLELTSELIQLSSSSGGKQKAFAFYQKNLVDPQRRLDEAQNQMLDYDQQRGE